MRWGLGSIAWPTGGMSFWRADKEGRKGEPATTEDRRLRLLELNCPSRCRCRSWPKRFDPDARKFPRIRSHTTVYRKAKGGSGDRQENGGRDGRLALDVHLAVEGGDPLGYMNDPRQSPE